MTDLSYEFINIHSLPDMDISDTLTLMSDTRRSRILRFPDAENRLRSIAAEYLARKMISERLSMQKSSVIIDRLKSGQPYLPGLPLYISLSHSGHLAMAAVCSRPVGADVELISDRGKRLLKRVCSPGEQQYILASGTFDNRRFFEVWTAKEALLKHSGKGLSGGIASTTVADRSGIFSEINGIKLIGGIHDGAAYTVAY